MNAKIMGTGYELPAFRADNDYLATLVDTSDEWTEKEPESVPDIWQKKRLRLPWQQKQPEKLFRKQVWTHPR